MGNVHTRRVSFRCSSASCAPSWSRLARHVHRVIDDNGNRISVHRRRRLGERPHWRRRRRLRGLDQRR